MNLKIVGAIGAAIVALMAAILALIFTGVLPNPFIGLFLNPPEHSARYYPRDTIAYGWFTFYPEDGQFEQMTDLWDRFNELPELKHRLDDLQDDIEDDSGFDFEDELETWIGLDVSVGLFEERNEPIGMITVAVRDSENAEHFMEEWTDYLEDEQDFDFDADDDDGISIWADEDQGLAFALTDDVLLTIFADELEQPLEDLLELAKGEEERSLAKEENFQKARALISERRFASAFLNVEELLDFLEDASLFPADLYGITTISDDIVTPDWAAMSMQWIDRGIVVEALMPNTEGYAKNLQTLANPAENVSAETIGLLAATFDPDLDNWRDQLEEHGSDDESLSYFVEELYDEMYLEVERQSERPPRLKDNPDLADILDLSLDLVESYSGIDLELDLMNYLGGQLFVKVEEFELDLIQENPKDETVNAVAMLSYLQEEEDSLADTLEELSELLEDEVDVNIDSLDVGAANDAEIFKPDFQGIEIDYTPSMFSTMVS